MPRKSATAYATAPYPNVRPTRLAPPLDLDAAAVATWRRIVGACQPDHFVAADSELLRAYVEAAVLSQEAFRELQLNGRIVDNRLSPWALLLEKSTRTLASLAPRLRLGPSARQDPKTTARAFKNGPPPSIYELMRDDVD